MPVSFETGDIFATPGIRAFAHGCNCAGAMGKGIAVLFRERWPAMYREYRRRCQGGDFALGDVFVWTQDNETVFNLGTQQSWNKKAELWAVEKALKEMVRVAEIRHVEEIALPRIAGGLGGLDWGDVRAILEAIGQSNSLTLRICDSYVKGQPMAR